MVDSLNNTNLQTNILAKNIKTLLEIHKNKLQKTPLSEKIAHAITDFSGSMIFVYTHAAWFGIWVSLNIFPFLNNVFDPYPFNLLTLIVSLEAIFLSTFLLISQKSLSDISEQRTNLDLQINLLTEEKIAKILEILIKITEQLNHMDNEFNVAYGSEVNSLMKSIEIREVLEQIENDKK